MFLILNEHSIEYDGNESESQKILENFIETFKTVIEFSHGKIQNSLHTFRDFKTVMLNPRYGYSVWRNQNIDKELLRKFLSICDRQQIISEPVNDEVEIRYNNYRDGSLLLAYENDHVLLSFATAKIWERSELEVTVDSIYDVDSKSCQLKNFYNKLVTNNNMWIEQLPTTAFVERYPNIESLRSNLAEALPNLLFHSKAIKQLEDDVRSTWYLPLANRLYELNEACNNMRGKFFDQSAFAPRTISSESPETLSKFKREYTFLFQNKQYIVKHHLRYTGNNNSQGRVYFVPIKDSKCIVYSLTTKLPTVNDPKESA